MERFGPWWFGAGRRVRSVLALAAITYGVVASAVRPAATGQGLAMVLLLAVCAAGWLTWLFQPGDERLAGPVGLVVTGLAGVALTLVTPHSPAIVFVGVAAVRAAHWWRGLWAAWFGLGLAVVYVVGHLAIGDSVPWLLAGPAVLALTLLMGYVRRQNDELVAQAEHAREEQARLSALDERARIAREIHDVLAHSLAALSVQLETADALLESQRPEQARTAVARAGQLAKEGIAETRRAIGALRGDTLPLPDLLKMLGAAYEADLGAPVHVEVTGQARDLRPDVSLTLYRTAQEAITNVRKHAPGASVDVALDYRPDDVTLAVHNGAGPAGGSDTAPTGGGYGLTGLRERAELAGGDFAAGAAPDGPGWRVDVRIPA
jgi:signal transduction histidine kinase